MNSQADLQVMSLQNGTAKRKTGVPGLADAAKQALSVPPLVSQDSASTMASATSPATQVNDQKLKEGLAQVQALGSDAKESQADETNDTVSPPPGLARQLTMGGYEEASQEATSTLDRTDTIPLDDQHGNGSGKKRAREDLQPEMLLKRQETIEELAEDESILERGEETDDPLKLAAETAPALYRMHSLVEGAGRGRLSIQRPMFDHGARDSPSIFSPPVVIDSLDGLFSNSVPPNVAFSATATAVAAKRTGLSEQADTEGETSVAKGPPVPITRQESWKEDVSDAGWRAW